ncbi:Coq4 family protein [Sphingobacterium sp. HJSM2_6]|uniref:Coq4 family protein n=1 Tax=Sphingobacterium sp. HJSM2_6 TaxID=3366264 RepID=UPI003BE27BBF
MRGIRLKFMLWLYNWSSRLYATVFKQHKQAWGLSKEDFSSFPKDSLGQALWFFYEERGFDVMPKLENHDVFHVLTGIDTAIQDEIAMQYLLLGNGKISVYLVSMLLIGTFLFPEYAKYYLDTYSRGKSMNKFYNLEFKPYLSYSVKEMQKALTINNLFIYQLTQYNHGK